MSRLILIDGLPGSGKSTLAQAIGDAMRAVVWYETDPEHPLHPVPADEVGAAWADIHERLSPPEFAEASLARWANAMVELDGPLVFESFPFQSGIRVLFQMNAAPELIEDYWQRWQRLVAPTQPHLIFLKTRAPKDLIDEVATTRGMAWKAYLESAVGAMPYAQQNGHQGWTAVHHFLENYNSLLETLLNAATVQVTTAPAKPTNYAERTSQLIAALRG